MSYFEAYNDAGSLQFNAEISSFYFVEKGYLGVVDQFIGGPFGGTSYLGTYGSATTNNAFDLVVFNTGDSTRTIFPKNSPLYSNKEIRVYGEKGTSDGYTPDPGILVYYWCFRAMQDLAPSSSGIGLEVYDQNSKVIYTTARAPLRVVGDIPITNTIGLNQFVAIPAGKTYAFLSYGSNIQSIGGNQAVSPAIAVNGATATIKPQTGASFSSAYDAYNGGIVTLDVSGY